jgi:hypothetical protein
VPIVTVIRAVIPAVPSRRVRGTRNVFSLGPALVELLRLGKVFLVIVAFVFSGCSQKTPTPDELAAKRGGRLGVLYGMCVGQNKGKPPQAVQQIKDFATKRINSEELSALGVTTIDDLFVSPRDGLPYKMVEYRKLPPPSGEPVVVFYEQQGQHGVRRAALLGGGTLDLDESLLAKLVPSFKP